MAIVLIQCWKITYKTQFPVQRQCVRKRNNIPLSHAFQVNKKLERKIYNNLSHVFSCTPCFKHFNSSKTFIILSHAFSLTLYLFFDSSNIFINLSSHISLSIENMQAKVKRHHRIWNQEPGTPGTTGSSLTKIRAS